MKIIKWFKVIFNILEIKDKIKAQEVFNLNNIKTINNQRKLIRELNNKVDDLAYHYRHSIKKVDDAVEEIKKRTDVHIEGGFNNRDKNTIIVIGRYRNHDFIEIYHSKPDHFRYLVEQLKQECKWGNMQTCDVPLPMKEIIHYEVSRK